MMETIITNHYITTEKAEHTLSIFSDRLPQLSTRAGMSWDPYQGAWIGDVLSRTIEYCDAVIQTKSLPTVTIKKANNTKLIYAELLKCYNLANPHFQFTPQVKSVYA